MGYITRTRPAVMRNPMETIDDYRQLTDQLRDGRALVPNDFCPEVNELAQELHIRLQKKKEKGNG